MKYRVIRDHSADNISVPLGTILYAAPEHQAHADSEARFNKKLSGIDLDLVAVSFEDRRGFFTFHRSSLEPIPESSEST